MKHYRRIKTTAAVIIFILFLDIAGTLPIKESLFTKRLVPNIRVDSINDGCKNTFNRTKRLFSCLTQCNLEDRCVAASFDRQRKACTTYEVCSFDNSSDISLQSTRNNSVETEESTRNNSVETEESTRNRSVETEESTRNRSVETEETVIWSKYCVNGQWDRSSQSCKCFKGFYGERCEKYPKLCDGLLKAGYEKGFYQILADLDQDGKDPFRIVCHISPPDQYNIQIMSSQGNMDFNRTWKEYENGFYENIYNHWGGLRLWNILSNKYDHDEVTINLIFKPNPYSSNIYRIYKSFKVEDAESLYVFSHGVTYVRAYGHLPDGIYTFGNCFADNQGIPFSTWDYENLHFETGCIKSMGHGWWFHDCYLKSKRKPCNLFGKWNSPHNKLADGKIQGQLFSVNGVDMDMAASLIDRIEIYITRSSIFT